MISDSWAGLSADGVWVSDSGSVATLLILPDAISFDGIILDGSTPFFAVTDIDIEFSAATPLPAALPLFATGLGALGLLGWRKKRRKQSGNLTANQLR
jgi:hypothetical protein